MHVYAADSLSLHSLAYFGLEMPLTHVKGSAGVNGLLKRDLAMMVLAHSQLKGLVNGPNWRK